MNLTQSDIVRAARRVARDVLDSIGILDVHEILEDPYGAISDQEAEQILDLASNATVVI